MSKELDNAKKMLIESIENQIKYPGSVWGYWSFIYYWVGRIEFWTKYELTIKFGIIFAIWTILLIIILGGNHG